MGVMMVKLTHGLKLREDAAPKCLSIIREFSVAVIHLFPGLPILVNIHHQSFTAASILNPCTSMTYCIMYSV